MAPQSSTYCFTCARPVDHPHQVHRLEDGASCPSCVERVLEVLPSLLPGCERLGEFEDVEPWRGNLPAPTESGPDSFDHPPDCA